MRNVKHSLAIIVSLLLTSVIFAQRKNDIPIDPSVRYGELSNGFTYFIRKNSDPADKVFLRFVVKAGNFHEDPDQLGLAHLLEHVAFNGTKHFPNDKLINYFNTIGLRSGNDYNATTGITTGYFINAPANNPQVFNNCLQIIRDWAGDMQLDPREIDEERGVVISEIRGGASLRSQMELSLNEKILGHPRYSVDQWNKHDSSINNAKVETVTRFYKDWYRPDLEAIIVVGNINVADVENKIIALFGDLKISENPRIVEGFESRFTAELKNKRQLIAISDDHLYETNIKIYQKRRADRISISSIQDMRLLLIDKLYNEMIGRRFEILLESNKNYFKKAFNSIERNAIVYTAGLDALTSQITLNSSQSIERAILTVMAELQRVAKEGFSPGELNAAVQKVEIGMRRLDANSRTNQNLAFRYEAYFTDRATAPSPEYEFSVKKNLLKEITLSEINTIAKSWINDNRNMDVVISTSPQIKLPSERTVLVWLTDAKKIKLPLYKQPEIISGMFVKDEDIPKVDRGNAIRDISVNDELDLKEINFNNGLRVWLKRCKSEGYSAKELKINGFRRGGLCHYSGSDVLNALKTGVINSNVITSKYDKFQLRKFFDEKNISLHTNINNQSTTIEASCNADDLEIIMQLLYLQMTMPLKNKNEIERSINLSKKEVERKRRIKDANSFEDSVNNILFKGSLNFRPFSIEEINQLNTDRIFEIYQKEFSNPSGLILLLTGDFDEEKATDLFIKYFGGLKGKDVEVCSMSMQNMPLGVKQSRTYYMGTAQMANVILYFTGQQKYSFKNDLVLEVLNQALSTKMRNRLREKEAGTYAPAIYCLHGIEMGGSFAYGIRFECDTANVEHMIAAARDELNQLRIEGLNNELFEYAKQIIKSQILNDLKSETFWSAYLPKQYINNQDIEEILKKSTMLDIMRIETINESAKQYLTDENMLRFVMLPQNIPGGGSE